MSQQGEDQGPHSREGLLEDSWLGEWEGLVLEKTREMKGVALVVAEETECSSAGREVSPSPPSVCPGFSSSLAFSERRTSLSWGRD